MISDCRPVRALFLLQRPEAWVNFASVWAAMCESQEFAPAIWLLPYNYSDPALSASRAVEARSLLTSHGIPFVEWHDRMQLNAGAWDVVIFGHPYDRERPPQLGFSRVAEVVAHTIYIPYGLPMGGGRKNLNLQYAQPTQIKSSVVVARSVFEKTQYAKHCPSGDAHVQILGHPRFDVLLKELDKQVPDDLADFCGTRTVLLWSSHFSFGHKHSQASNFSTFDLFGPELFDYALQHRDDCCLLWRPHPGLIPALVRDRVLAENELTLLRAELRGNGIFLDESPGHAAAFRVSDGLLSDTGSFLIEYLATGKPILALTNPEGEPLNEEGEALVARLSRAVCLQDIERFIEGVQTGTISQELSEARLDHMPLLDGTAGKRVANLAKSLVLRRTDRDGQIEQPEDCFQPLSGAKGLPGGVSPLRWSDCSAPTPTLNKLCDSLRQSRLAKSQELRIRKWIRRKLNEVRTWGVESLKRQDSFRRS